MDFGLGCSLAPFWMLSHPFVLVYWSEIGKCENLAPVASKLPNLIEMEAPDDFSRDFAAAVLTSVFFDDFDEC